ncbi:MAG: hypothetical protein C0434_03935 [Xanthomonadaceae bacterium]|nr:hypothetical protein [Xanthomonadaceae bacterium]
MNLQQQREEARRRRLINRSVVQHRQRYFDDVRRGVVTQSLPLGRVLPGPLTPSPLPMQEPEMIDSPAITLTLKFGIVAAMFGLLVQFREPLLNAVLSLLPGVTG